MMFFHLETIKPITFLRLETTKLTTPRSGGLWARLFFVFLFSYVLYAYGVVALTAATR